MVHVAMKLQKEVALESDVLDMVANPMRFVRREEIAVKVRSLMWRVAGRGVRARMGRDGARGVRPRRQQEGHCDGSSQPSEKKKKEKGVTVVTQTSLAN
jgi:hypothetical protein